MSSLIPVKLAWGPQRHLCCRKRFLKSNPFRGAFQNIVPFVYSWSMLWQSENSLLSLASPSILRLHHVSPWKRLGFLSLAVSFLLSSQPDQRICCCICFCMTCGVCAYVMTHTCKSEDTFVELTVSYSSSFLLGPPACK